MLGLKIQSWTGGTLLGLFVTTVLCENTSPFTTFVRISPVCLHFGYRRCCNQCLASRVELEPQCLFGFWMQFIGTMVME